MTIKTILVPLDGSDSGYNVLETSLIVANRFGAHISALHVSHSLVESATYQFSGLPQSLRQSVEDQDRETLDRKADEIRNKFEAFCEKSELTLSDKPGSGGTLTASWHHDYGVPADVLTDYARIHDVCAFGRPQKKEGVLTRGVVGETLQEVMLESGRPILVVPPEWQARKCEHAVIGWNHSQEASRAVAMTLPWLAQMESVTVVVSKQREQRGQQLVDYLELHGIKAGVKILNRGSRSAGERLLDLTREEGGDFLVAGGYSTQRSRERLFGGVTDLLLRKSDVITVLVH